jgi:hypothetical protein
MMVEYTFLSPYVQLGRTVRNAAEMRRKARINDV